MKCQMSNLIDGRENKDVIRIFNLNEPGYRKCPN